MPISVAIILGALVAIGGTVVSFIFILPDKKRNSLNGFFRWAHDFLNFKELWIEKILKALYIFETFACIAIGFFMLFSVEHIYGWFSSSTVYLGGFGILLIILGPVVVRLIYEGLMLMVLLVKNVMDINNKLNPQEGSVADKTAKIEAEKEAKAAELALQKQQQMAQQQYAQHQYQPPYQPPQQYAQPPQQQPQQPQYPQTQMPQQYQAPNQFNQNQ